MLFCLIHVLYEYNLIIMSWKYGPDLVWATSFHMTPAALYWESLCLCCKLFIFCSKPTHYQYIYIFYLTQFLSEAIDALHSCWLITITL